MSLFSSVADNISTGAVWGKRIVKTATGVTVEAGKLDADLSVAILRANVIVGDGIITTASEASVGIAKTAFEVVKATVQTDKEMAGAIIRTAKEVTGATLQTTKEVSSATIQTGKEIGGALGTALLHPTEIGEDDLNRSIDYVQQKADDASGYIRRKSTDSVNYIDRKADDALDYIDKKTEDAAEWVIQKKNATTAWAKEKAWKAYNNVARAAAISIGAAATRYKPIEACLQGIIENLHELSPEEIEKAKQLDGKYIGNDCKNPSSTPPVAGATPADGCKGRSRIIYTNGINTPPEAACKTMHLLADELCVEVVGVYNATFGEMHDTVNARDSIDNKGQQASAHSQAKLVVQMLSTKPPQPVTLFAHSEGGLITQEALTEADRSLIKNIREELISTGMSEEEAQKEAGIRATALMNNVDVYSFGTAEMNWPPVGAHYHQYTNTADLVPLTIRQVQENRGNTTEPAKLVERYRFEKIPSSFDLFASHYMDDIYLPEFAKIRPVKKINGKCC